MAYITSRADSSSHIFRLRTPADVLARGGMNRRVLIQFPEFMFSRPFVATTTIERNSVTRGSSRAPEAPKRPLAPELADDTWTGKTARLALPILIDLAERKGKMTYTELAKAVEARGGTSAGTMTKYSFPLGKIATAMQRLSLPALTTLVVNAADRLPSYGIDVFIADHFQLNHAGREALKNDPKFRPAKVEQLWDEVYRYQDWREKMADLGLTGDPEYDL